MAASAYLSFHHANPFFFQQATTLVTPSSNPTGSPAETEPSDDDNDDDEHEDDEDDEDERSSIISIESKPNPSASLIKHSIANILSNKITVKNKRPFSSSSNCKCFASYRIVLKIFSHLASIDEAMNNKRPKLMAC